MHSIKRVGVIGLGEMGKRLAHDLRVTSAGSAEIVAAVEPGDAVYRSNCEFLGSTPKRYASIPAMLRAEKLDGLILATPDNCHYDCLRQLEGRRIPILHEKPLDADLAKICNIMRFAHRYRAPIMVDHCMRYSPISQKARELLDGGAIGKICSVHFVQNCPYGDHMFRHFYRTRRGGGGMMIEKATHDLDLMLNWLKLRPMRVAAMARQHAYGGKKPNSLTCATCRERITCLESVHNSSIRFGENKIMEYQDRRGLCVYAREIDVPDNETCMIEFAGGVFGTYSQCFFSPNSYTTREYEIAGLEGIMRVSYTLVEHHKQGKIAVYPRFGTPQDVFEWKFDYRGRIHYNAGDQVARAFYRVMEGKQKPITTVAQAFAAEILGYAANRAAQQGKFVEVASLVPRDLMPVWNGLWKGKG